MYKRCRLTTLLSVRPFVTLVVNVETTQHKVIKLVFIAWWLLHGFLAPAKLPCNPH